MVVQLKNGNVPTTDEVREYHRSKGLRLGSEQFLDHALSVVRSQVALCSAPRTINERGYEDEFAGWYDLYGCGQCNHYCRWVGGDGSGGDPSISVETKPQTAGKQPGDGRSFWACKSSQDNEFNTKFPLPFIAERCYPIDAILNSTRHVFGDTSPGHIAALAETRVVVKNLKCLKSWTAGFDAVAGFTCQPIPSSLCGSQKCKDLCNESDGKWDDVAAKCFYGKGCPTGWTSDGVRRSHGFECIIKARDEKTHFVQINPVNGPDQNTKKQQCESRGGSVSIRNVNTNFVRSLSMWKSITTMDVVCTLPDTYEHLLRKPEIPGHCCLDDSDVSGIWGELYQCGQTCKNYAPSLAGISPATCDLFGGVWCQNPTNCSPLKECVSEYLKTAEDSTTSTYNPTYASYLRDAPNITNPQDLFQCGRVREYFGFEATFSIDLKICDEVKEYRNARDFDFLNDVFENMPPGKTPGNLPGNKEDLSIEKDSETVASRLIRLSEKTKFKDAEEPTETCTSELMATLKDIMFGLDIAVEVLEAIKGDADAFECPEDITGAVKTVCALSKNIASIVLSVIVSTIRLGANAGLSLYEEVCSELDPYSIASSFEEIVAIHENTAIMYDVLASRHLESHKSLNHISSQLPKLSKQTANVQETLEKKLNKLLRHFGIPIDGGRRLRGAANFTKGAVRPANNATVFDHGFLLDQEPDSSVEDEDSSTEATVAVMMEEMKSFLTVELNIAQAELNEELAVHQSELKAEVKAEVKAELAVQQIEWKAELAAQQAELKAGFKDELTAQQNELKAELATQQGELKGELSTIKEMLQAFLARTEKNVV